MSAPAIATPGISLLALAAQRVIEAQWFNGPAHHLATQAAMALESAGMLCGPERAQEIAATAREELLAEQAAASAAAARRVAVLSDAQRMALVGAARGETVESDAARRGLSPNTVKTNRQRALVLLGVSSAPAAVALALVSGQITADDVLGGAR